jgi:hypothetical protein
MLLDLAATMKIALRRGSAEQTISMRDTNETMYKFDNGPAISRMRAWLLKLGIEGVL